MYSTKLVNKMNDYFKDKSIKVSEFNKNIVITNVFTKGYYILVFVDIIPGRGYEPLSHYRERICEICEMYFSIKPDSVEFKFFPADINILTNTIEI